MKILVMFGVLLTLCVGYPLQTFPQSKAPSSQQAGDCSVNITGNDNTASLVCTGVDAKLAEQVRAILNSTRRNENAAKDMSEKLDRIITQMDKQSIPPQVALRFVYPKSPLLVVVNQSTVIARSIALAFALWNMDLPDRDNPLPIPTNTFDWIKPHAESGPEDLFGIPSVAQLLKPGDRLFGSVSVGCAECARGRTYVVYIVWGESGWYSEVGNEQSGDLIVPIDFSKASRINYFKSLEAIPAESRTPIVDPRGKR